MNIKGSLYAVIGGVVGAVLTLAVCSVMPIGAQSQSDGVFGKITCTGLDVVDAEGNTKISLLGGGMVFVYGSKGGAVWLHVNDYGGSVSVLGKARLVPSGGNENDQFLKSAHALIDAMRGTMAVDEYGNGGVRTWDKNGYRLATLK